MHHSGVAFFFFDRQTGLTIPYDAVQRR